MANLDGFLRFVDGAADRIGTLNRPLVASALIDSIERRWRRARLSDDSFREPLCRLFDCYEREANLNVFGRLSAKWDAVRCLENLIRFDLEEEAVPCIRDIEIKRPIFITGLPRSGTTFLHTLLSCDPDILIPRCWQTIFPYPAQSRKRDTRRSRVEKQLRLFQQIAPELRALHPMSSNGPQECTEITAQVFQSLRYEMTHNVPSYQTWLDSVGHLDAYRFHKRFLQHLQHQNAKQDRRQPQWILKCPDHIHALDAIETVYPDARFVFVHRDPVRVIPSAAKLTEVVRRPFTRGTNAYAIGAQVVARAVEAASIMMARAKDDASRAVVHVHYADLAERPLAIIEALYARFGLQLRHHVRADMSNLVAATRNGNGSYSLEMFGLDPGALRSQFEDYIRYFSVRREAQAWKALGAANAPIAA
jgi:hypothetical protein